MCQQPQHSHSAANNFLIVVSLEENSLLKNPSWHAERFLSYVKNFYSFHSLIVFINALTHLQVRWSCPLGSVRVQTCTSPMKKWLEFYDLCKAMAYDIRGLKLYLAELLLSPFVENKRQVSAVWCIVRWLPVGSLNRTFFNMRSSQILIIA